MSRMPLYVGEMMLLKLSLLMVLMRLTDLKPHIEIMHTDARQRQARWQDLMYSQVPCGSIELILLKETSRSGENY